MITDIPLVEPNASLSTSKNEFNLFIFPIDGVNLFSIKQAFQLLSTEL